MAHRVSTRAQPTAARSDIRGMPLRKPPDLLVELITSLYERPNEVPPSHVAGTPHPLLKGWLIIEEMSIGSSKYVLLRSGNDRHLRQVGWQSLTEREREALHLACNGATNKLIAYQMGITASTVGVLLGRASRKFGVGRGDLLRTARASTTAGFARPRGTRG